MADIVVELSKEYTAHKKTFKEIVLREPTYAEICMSGLGRPQEWQRLADGGAMLITYHSVIDDYLKKIIRAPEYSSILSLSAKDTLTLQKTVCDFFI